MAVITIASKDSNIADNKIVIYIIFIRLHISTHINMINRCGSSRDAQHLSLARDLLFVAAVATLTKQKKKTGGDKYA